MKFKKEPVILIATHGPFCTGLLETVKMIYGELDNVTAMSLKQGQAVEEYEKEIEVFLEEHDNDVVLLLDFIGGSPFNTAMKLCRNRELCAVAGVNFGMVAAAVELRSEYDDSAQLAAEIEKAAHESMKDVTPVLTQMYETAKAIGEEDKA